MKSLSQGLFAFLVLLLLLAGCTTTPVAQPIESTAAALQSTGSPAQSASNSIAALTANDVNVEVLSKDKSEQALDRNETINIQESDRILLDDRGRGVLFFGDSHEAELFRNTEVQIVEAKLEPGGSTFLRLKQFSGHLHFLLNEQAFARVTLETDDSTINTLEQGTEFIICKAPGKLTCLAVREGAVEVISQGMKLPLRGGEATYYTPGQPPQPPICMQEEEVAEWLNMMHGPQEVQSLGQMVASWPQDPCPAAISESTNMEISALPSSEGMVKIESSLYEVGSSQPDDYHAATQQIQVADFWIDAYEVTNAQYQQFMSATGQPQPVVWPGEADHPVKGVTWDEAAAFCAWKNKRLPTEVEWEVAARGPGPNPPLYPWGNDPLAAGQVSDLDPTDTYAVGTVPYNKSPFGVYDLAGNVWEWVDTDTAYAPVADGYKVLRGGRHGLIRDSAYRQPAAPPYERFIPYAGFRCAAGQVEGE